MPASRGERGPAGWGTLKLKKWYLRISNFDLTFCKVYIYAKGWPGINLGASHESGTHPTGHAIRILSTKCFHKRKNKNLFGPILLAVNHRFNIKLQEGGGILGNVFEILALMIVRKHQRKN